MSDRYHANPIGVPRVRAAMEQIRPELARLEKRDLIPVNIDLLAAVTTTQGALPKRRALREAFELDCKRFDAELLDKLDTYSLAALGANAAYVAASTTERLPNLVAEAVRLHALFLCDAKALAGHGLLDPAKLRQLNAPNGFLNVAKGVGTLAAIFRFNWDRIATKTAVTEADLDRAEVLSDQIVVGIGRRKCGVPSNAAAALERQQAFTLLVRTYDQLRRAVYYVRWDEGDAEDIAPSLYAGRRKAKKRTEDTKESAPVELPCASSVVASPGGIDDSAATSAAAMGQPGFDPFA